MFMNWKIKHCQGINSSSMFQCISWTPDQHTSTLFWEFWQTDSKVNMGSQKTKNSQDYIEKWVSKNNTTWLYLKAAFTKTACIGERIDTLINGTL